MSLDDQERWAIDQIEALQREYHERAKPFVDMLVRIRSLQPPPPIYLSKEAYEAFKKGATS